MPINDPNTAVDEKSKRGETNKPNLDQTTTALKAAKELIDKAEKGDAKAQYTLSRSYLSFDPQIGIAWLQKSADQKYPQAQNILGLAHLEGKIIAFDEEAAFQHFLSAAEQGLTEAQINVANCYLDGFGTDNDPKKAYHYFREAAFKNHPKASFQLAQCYLRGIGVNPDPHAAFHFFNKAAALNNIDSIYWLGLCHLNGIGTPFDPQKAQECFQKAGIQKPVIVITLDIDETLFNFETKEWLGGEDVWIDFCEKLKVYADQLDVELVFGIITAKPVPDNLVGAAVSALRKHFNVVFNNKSVHPILPESKDEPLFHILNVDKVQKVNLFGAFQNYDSSSRDVLFTPVHITGGQLNKSRYIDRFAKYYRPVHIFHLDDDKRVEDEINKKNDIRYKVLSAKDFSSTPGKAAITTRLNTFTTQINAAIRKVGTAFKLKADAKAAVAPHSTLVSAPAVASPITKSAVVPAPQQLQPPPNTPTAAAPVAESRIG